MNNFNDIVNSCLLSIKDDYTQLWVISGTVSEKNPTISLSENLQFTKRVVKHLMDNHGVKVIDEETEKPTDMTSTEALKKIDDTYLRINDFPNIGDGLWFG